MSKSLDLISIVMPLYNSEKYISESIESVLSQTYNHWELIVVDDKSTDNSSMIVESYAHKDNRVKLINLDTNVGPTKARNRAIEEANGRYISFLDSDDMWLPDKLQQQIIFLNKNNLVLTYSTYETMDENSKYINTRKCLPIIKYKDMLKSNQIGNLTGIYDVNFFGKVYMEDTGHEDYVLWLKLLKQVSYTKGLTKTLARYRIVPNSISSNKLKVLKWQWHIYRKIEKLTILQSSYYFIFYIYNALKKRS
jgi:glycosyltransferase involved in cell wall biosynthesis